MIKIGFNAKYRTNCQQRHIILLRISLRNKAETITDKEARIPLVREKLDFDSLNGHAKEIYESEGHL